MGGSVEGGEDFRGWGRIETNWRAGTGFCWWLNVWI